MFTLNRTHSEFIKLYFSLSSASISHSLTDSFKHRAVRSTDIIITLKRNCKNYVEEIFFVISKKSLTCERKKISALLKGSYFAQIHFFLVSQVLVVSSSLESKSATKNIYTQFNAHISFSYFSLLLLILSPLYTAEKSFEKRKNSFFIRPTT